MATAKLRKSLWWAVAMLAPASWLACFASGITIGTTPGLYIGFMLAVPMLSAMRKDAWSPMLTRFVDILECHLLLAVLGLCGALLSYAAMAQSTGYTDGLLAAADAAIGFDWVGLRRTVEAWPALMRAGFIAYGAFFVMPTVAIVALVWTGRTERAYLLVAAYAAAVLLTAALFYLFPARSAFQYYFGDHPDALPIIAENYGRAIDQIRAGTIGYVDLKQLEGIVTFPSFHAAAALLFIWAVWPIPRLRTAMAVANGAMLVSATFIGGHYLVDIFGGAGVAWAGLWIARRVASVREAEPAPPEALPVSQPA